MCSLRLDDASRITSLADLPGERILSGYIRAAARLNDTGVKAPARPRPATAKELEIPADLAAALKKNKKALATFAAFSHTNKKEYVDWLTEAKI